jgi:hypothetical protein
MTEPVGYLVCAVALVPNELPFHLFYLLVASTLLALGEGTCSTSTGRGSVRPTARRWSTCTGAASTAATRTARDVHWSTGSRAMSALTPNDPVLQPGFEQADTTVTAAICLYGYFGPLDGDTPQLPSSPVRHVRGDAPPFFLAHGELDTLTPVEDARRFVARLRGTSAAPVVYAELPGGQHSFDLFHSLRFEAVVDGVEAFAAWVRSGAARARLPRAGE